MSDSLNPYAPPQALEKPTLQPPESPFSFPAAPYVSSRTKANIAMAATAFVLLMQLLLIGSLMMQISLLSGAQAAGELDAAAAEANDSRHMAISIGFIVVLIASFIMFLVWIYAAQKNLPALRPTNPLEFSPGWAVGWFFVPIMNLFKPFQAMRQLWNESDPSLLPMPGMPHPIAPAAALVGWWWGLRIVSGIAGRISGNVDQTTIEGLISASGVAIALMACLDIPLYLCQLFMIRRVQTNQEERFAKVEKQAMAATSPAATVPDDPNNPWAKFQ